MSLIRAVVKALYAEELTRSRRESTRRGMKEAFRDFGEFFRRHRLCGWAIKAAGVLALATVVWGLVRCYNDYGRLATRSEAYLAQVGVELKRRNNLIPNLVASARRYASHEGEVFTHVCDAREMLMKAKGPAEKIMAANMLDAALSKLMALVEQYPDLKATQSIQDLIKELANTEDRIAQEKTKYNEVARGFNQLRQTFPTNILGRLYGFNQDLPYLGTNEEMLDVPRVHAEWTGAPGEPVTEVKRKEGVRNEDG